MIKCIVYFVLILIIPFQVKSQDYSYTEGSKRKGIKVYTEKVTLKIDPVLKTQPVALEAFSAIAGALIGPLIDVGVSLAKDVSEKNAKKFIAEYSCSNSGDMFYMTKTDINLPALTIIRKIAINDKNDRMVSTPAVKIELEPELSSDQFSFRYKVKSIDLDYSKAKTKGDYDYIDFKLDIKFKTLSIADKKYEVSELRAFSINIPSVKVNGAYDPKDLSKSSWLPFPPAPEHMILTEKLSEETKTTKKNYLKTDPIKKNQEAYEEASTEKSTVVKKEDVASISKLKTGTYEFEITITESNPYKIKAENKKQFIEKNSESGAALLKAIGETIFPKEDNAKEEEKEEGEEKKVEEKK